jgi:hypothetical protein
LDVSDYTGLVHDTMKRIWAEIRKDTPNECKLVVEEYDNTDNLSIAPIPILPDPRQHGRISYSTWRYLNAETIEEFISDVLQGIRENLPVVNVSGSSFDLSAYGDGSINENDFVEDACYWLYLNSESSLRSFSPERDDNIFVVKNRLLSD